MSRRIPGPAVALAAILFTPMLAGPAAADLIGIQPGFPQIFYNSQGVTSYNAGTDLFTVVAVPSTMRFMPGFPPQLVLPTGDPPFEIVSISIVVDGSGNLVGGVAGDDLLVVGEVDVEGNGSIDYDGVLLTGEILDFGFLNASFAFASGPANVDSYDFRFEVTGGSLAPLFGDQDAGVVLTSERSTFSGSFTVDFFGEAKGSLGPVEALGGACCFRDGSCEEASPEECEMEGGIFQGNGTDCPDLECGEPKGACCFDDGSCAVVTQATCDAAGGDYGGDGTICAPNPCPQPVGACCFDDGSCAVLTQAACLAQGGLPQGAGTGCAPNPCPQPVGVCCFGSGCAILPMEVCLAYDGVPGPGTSCSQNPCAAPGACCFDDGACSILSQGQCASAGGFFLGQGTTCGPVVCPGPKGACCLGDFCGVFTQETCDAADGDYQGDDTICVPNPCD